MKEELTLADIEKAAGEVFGEDPYPKYLGNGLYEVAPGFVCPEKMMERIGGMIRQDAGDLEERTYEVGGMKISFGKDRP